MYKKIMVSIFMIMLISLPIFSLIFMPKDKYPFSENENRYLSSFPELTLKNLKNKKFMTGFDSWASDMFVGREKWISLKNNTERIIGKLNISQTYTFDGRIVQVFEGYESSELKKNLDAMNEFAKRHFEVPMFFMPVPTAQEIYKDTLPDAAITGNQLNFISECESYLTNITTINTWDILFANKENYIYYRTDHHWTSFGSYLGYSKAAEVMGFSGLDIGKFNIERVSHDFRGSLYSKTLDTSIIPDIIDYYTLSEEEPDVTISVIDDKGTTDYPYLYFREYLDRKDKYASFLGQNAPILKIKTDLEGNSSKLLIFKDSYAHSLIPFLSKNYSEITVCDMRYINLDYNQYLDVEEYDQVMFIYNIITFSEDFNIRKLNLGE